MVASTGQIMTTEEVFGRLDLPTMANIGDKILAGTDLFGMYEAWLKQHHIMGHFVFDAEDLSDILLKEKKKFDLSQDVSSSLSFAAPFTPVMMELGTQVMNYFQSFNMSPWVTVPLAAIAGYAMLGYGANVLTQILTKPLSRGDIKVMTIGLAAAVALALTSCGPTTAPLPISLADIEYYEYVKELQSDDGTIYYGTLEGSIEATCEMIYQAKLEIEFLYKFITPPGSQKSLSPSPSGGDNYAAIAERQILVDGLTKRLMAYNRFTYEMGLENQDHTKEYLDSIDAKVTETIRQFDKEHAIDAVKSLLYFVPVIGSGLIAMDTIDMVKIGNEYGWTPLLAGMVFLNGAAVTLEVAAGAKAVSRFISPAFVDAIKLGDKYYVKEGEQFIEYAIKSNRITKTGAKSLEEFQGILNQLNPEELAGRVNILEIGPGSGFAKVPQGSQMEAAVTSGKKVLFIGVDASQNYSKFNPSDIRKLFSQIADYDALAIGRPIESVTNAAKGFEWLRFVNPWQPTGHLIYFNAPTMRAVLEAGTNIQGIFSINTLYDVLRSPGNVEVKTYVFNVFRNSESLSKLVPEASPLYAFLKEGTPDEAILTQFYKENLALHSKFRPEAYLALKQELTSGGMEKIFKDMYSGYDVKFTTLHPEIFSQISPHSWKIGGSRDMFYVVEVLHK